MKWVRHPFLGVKATDFADNRTEEKLTKAKAWQSRNSSDSREVAVRGDR